MISVWGPLILVTISVIFPNIFAQTDGDQGDDASCKDTPFVRLTENRYISLQKLSWENAKQCCEDRSMILHTPEAGNDFSPGALIRALDAYVKEIGDTAAPFWTSGRGRSSGNEADGSTYAWWYTTPAGRDAEMYWKQMADKHLWVEKEPDDPSEDSCLAVQATTDPSIYEKMFVGISAKPCDEERNFICQYTQNLRWGNDLSLKEIEFCKDLTMDNFHNITSDYYVYTDQQLPWLYAKYCCEQVGMMLAENFVDNIKLNLKVMEALDALQEKIQFHYTPFGTLDNVGFWVGLNAVCNTTWMWPCNEKDPLTENWALFNETIDPPLYRPPADDGKYKIKTPNNLLRSEYCGEVEYDLKHGIHDLNPKKKTKLQKEDTDCNTGRYFICQKKTKCSSGRPFSCERPEYNEINIEANAPEDKVFCNGIEFELLGNHAGYEYYISKWDFGPSLDGRYRSNLFTWAGGMKCIEEQLGFLPVSFTHPDDREFFTTYFPTDTFMQRQLIWVNATNTNQQYENEDIISNEAYIDITPLCGAIGYFQEKTGIVLRHCLERHHIAYKKEVMVVVNPDNETVVGPPVVGPPVVDIGNNNTIIDPIVIRNETRNQSTPCVNRDIALLLPSICPNLSTTINRPSAKQIQSNINRATPEELHKLRYQNRKLKESVIDIAVSGTPYFAHNPRNTLRLASLVAGVYIAQCPEVPRYFVEDILHYIHRLHFFTSQGRNELFNENEFLWMRKLMLRCVNESSLLNFRTDECGELTYSVDTCPNFICPQREYEFNTTRYDPMVEAWWKMYELAHAVCFEFFHESYRMFHLYAQAFMDSFSEGLRLRLAHQINSNKFWERILGPEYELNLLNMDRCNEAVIMRSSLPYRQHISTLPTRVRLHGARLGKTANTSSVAPS